MPDETPTPDPDDHPEVDAHLDDDYRDDDRDAPRDEDADERGESADERTGPPTSVVDEAERLTRLARDAVDDEEATAYRDHRASVLAEYGYTARVREDDTRDVLVVHPAEWVADGGIRPERIDDLGRGIERPLSGPGEADEWAVVDDHNREVVDQVRERYGDDHAANVDALADFMSNHYAKPIDDATRAELREFLTDYYPRNAWPTDSQSAIVEKSVRIAFDVLDERCPIERPR